MEPNTIQDNNNQPAQPIMPKQKKQISSWLGFTIIAIFIIVLFGGAFAYQYFFVIKDVKNVESVKKNLPTSFRLPSEDPKTPYIKDAQIERIEIPGYPGMYADIVMSIDGVSYERIIEINDELTAHVFKSTFDSDTIKDIRKKENRVLGKDIKEIALRYGFNSKIIYLDKNFLEYNIKYGLVLEGAIHPEYSYGLPSTIDIKTGKTLDFVFEDDDKVYGKDFKDYKVLNYFYPNGYEIIKNVPVDSDLWKNCFSYVDDKSIFPEDFHSTLRVSTKEVVFTRFFPYVYEFCTPKLQIAIPIEDILREVPQYVPKDSVLWEFK